MTSNVDRFRSAKVAALRLLEEMHEAEDRAREAMERSTNLLIDDMRWEFWYETFVSHWADRLERVITCAGLSNREFFIMLGQHCRLAEKALRACYPTLYYPWLLRLHIPEIELVRVFTELWRD